MQEFTNELKKGLSESAPGFDSELEHPVVRNDPHGLLKTAKQFSSYALDTFNNELLVKALMLSKAIADFNDELYGQK